MSDTGSPSFDAAIREIARLNAIVKAYEDGGKISAHLTAQSVKDHAKTNGELIRLRAINAELLAAAEKLANAADFVGVNFFDTDTMDPLVESMQSATQKVRAAIAKAKGEDK